MYKRILRKRILKGTVIALALFAVIPVTNAAARPLTDGVNTRPVGLHQTPIGPTAAELEAVAVLPTEITAGIVGKAYGPTPAQLKADIARGQGMNQKYHLGQYAIRPSEITAGLIGQPDSWLQSLVLNQKYSTGELKADIARSQGLNQKHRYGQYTVSSAFATLSQPQTVVSSTGSDFQWSNAWIGAGLLAVLLFGAAATLAVRSRHQGGLAH